MVNGILHWRDRGRETEIMLSNTGKNAAKDGKLPYIACGSNRTWMIYFKTRRKTHIQVYSVKWFLHPEEIAYRYGFFWKSSRTLGMLGVSCYERRGFGTHVVKLLWTFEWRKKNTQCLVSCVFHWELYGMSPELVFLKEFHQSVLGNIKWRDNEPENIQGWNLATAPHPSQPTAHLQAIPHRASVHPSLAFVPHYCFQDSCIIKRYFFIAKCIFLNLEGVFQWSLSALRISKSRVPSRDMIPICVPSHGSTFFLPKSSEDKRNSLQAWSPSFHTCYE